MTKTQRNRRLLCGALMMAGMGIAMPASAAIWDSTVDTNFNAPANYQGNTNPSGANVVFPDTAALVRNPALTANITITSLSIDNAGGDYSIGGTNSLTFNAPGSNNTKSNEIVLTNGGTTVISANVVAATSSNNAETRVWELGGGTLQLAGELRDGPHGSHIFRVNDGNLLINDLHLTTSTNSGVRGMIFDGDALIAISGNITSAVSNDSGSSNRVLETASTFTGTLRIASDFENINRSGIIHRAGTLQAASDKPFGDQGVEWLGGAIEAFGAERTVTSQIIMPGAPLREVSGSQKLNLNGNLFFNETGHDTVLKVTNTELTTLGGNVRMNTGNEHGRTRTFEVADGSHLLISGWLHSDHVDASNNLVKTGAGILELTDGTNNYTQTGNGNTTVNDGTLLVNNATGSATGAGNVIVNGGTLGGNGFIDGNITVNSGGAINPGNSVGTLTANNNVTFNDGAIYQYDITGGDSDLLFLSNAASTLSLDSAMSIQLFADALVGLSDNGTFTLFSGAGSFLLDGLSVGDTGFDTALTTLEGNISSPDGSVLSWGNLEVVTSNSFSVLLHDVVVFQESTEPGTGVIPEPTAAALTLLGLAGLTLRRRRVLQA